MTTLNTQQILMPKKVYIGDSAELRITFTSSQEIKTFKFDGSLDYSIYTINNTELTKTGLNYYQLSINFIPWVTGDIHFPSIELEAVPKAENVTEGTDLPSADLFSIKVEPVNIVSLVEQNQVTGLLASKNPMLIPGTTYKLYGAIATIIVVLIVGINLLVKHKQLATYIQNRKLLKKYKKNKKHTQKTLKKLEAADVSDKNFAESVQNLMRIYLETRFEYPFTKSVTSEIVKGFCKATCDLASDKKMDAITQISGLFVRTDYIRYSQNQEFNQNEKSEIVQSLLQCIETLEYIPPKVDGMEVETNV